MKQLWFDGKESVAPFQLKSIIAKFKKQYQGKLKQAGGLGKIHPASTELLSWCNICLPCINKCVPNEPNNRY